MLRLVKCIKLKTRRYFTFGFKFPKYKFVVFGSPLSNEPSGKTIIYKASYNDKIEKDSEEEDKEEQWLPSYIRDKRRGSSTK